MLNSGGREAFLHYALQLDLKGWHPRDAVPQTAALNIQKGLSLTGLNKIIYGMLSTGELPGWIVDSKSKRHVGNSHLLDYARLRLGYHVPDNAPNELLGGVLGFAKDKNPSRGHNFPDLKTARAMWDAKLFKGPWSNDADEWTLVEDRSRPKVLLVDQDGQPIKSAQLNAQVVENDTIPF